MFKYKFTTLFTLFGLFVCVFNYYDYDKDFMLLYFTSIPVWIIELFTDIHSTPMIVVYFLTVVQWAAIGYFIDRLASQRRERIARTGS